MKHIPIKARQWQVVSFQQMPPCLACIKWMTYFSLFLTMTGNDPSSSKDLPVTCEVKTSFPVTSSMRLALITSWSKPSSILKKLQMMNTYPTLVICCASWVSWPQIIAYFYFSDWQLAMMKEVILSNLKSHNLLLLNSVLETVVQANSLRLKSWLALYNVCQVSSTPSCMLPRLTMFLPKATCASFYSSTWVQEPDDSVSISHCCLKQLIQWCTLIQR